MGLNGENICSPVSLFSLFSFSLCLSLSVSLSLALSLSLRLRMKAVVLQASLFAEAQPWNEEDDNPWEAEPVIWGPKQ